MGGWGTLREGEHRAEPGGSHFQRHGGHAEEHAVTRAENNIGFESEQGVKFGTSAPIGGWGLNRLYLHGDEQGKKTGGVRKGLCTFMSGTSSHCKLSYGNEDTFEGGDFDKARCVYCIGHFHQIGNTSHASYDTTHNTGHS